MSEDFPGAMQWHRHWLARMEKERGTEAAPVEALRWHHTSQEARNAAAALRAWAERNAHDLGPGDRWDLAGIGHQLDGQALVLDDVERMRDYRSAHPDHAGLLMNQRMGVARWQASELADPGILASELADLDQALHLAYAREQQAPTQEPTVSHGADTHLLALREQHERDAERFGVPVSRVQEEARTVAGSAWRTEREALGLDEYSDFAFHAEATRRAMTGQDRAELDRARVSLRQAGDDQARATAAKDVTAILQAVRQREASRRDEPTRAAPQREVLQRAGWMTPEQSAQLDAGRAVVNARQAMLDAPSPEARRAAALEMARLEREQREKEQGRGHDGNGH